MFFDVKYTGKVTDLNKSTQFIYICLDHMICFMSSVKLFILNLLHMKCFELIDLGSIFYIIIVSIKTALLWHNLLIPFCIACFHQRGEQMMSVNDIDKALLFPWMEECRLNCFRLIGKFQDTNEYIINLFFFKVRIKTFVFNFKLQLQSSIHFNDIF